MTWQAPAAPPADPFTAIAADVRSMASSPWWMSAAPLQRAQALTARMLAGAGEWWLFGAWGRWYRCGLDGNWHLCPPPFDPAARQAMMPAPPGAGRPPVPPSLLPAGPDLTPGPLAADGLFGPPPDPGVLARLRQAVATAAAVNAAQFPLLDPQFAPGTPGTVAASFFTVMWCAGAPAADPDNALIGVYERYLAGADPGARWFLPPSLPLIVGAYAERLRAGDPMGAAHVARTIWETAETLRGEAAFRPRADALAAMAGATSRLVHADHGAVRFGDQAVVQEWLRRCPPHLRVTVLRETAPGDHFRLTLYDLAAAAAPLPAAVAGPAEARRVALALLAADLDGVPGSAAAVLPWLDPDAVRTVQALGRADHPLRALWPVGGTLPDAVAGADPQILRTLLAAAYATALAWCRLAGTAPPRPGFTVPAALMTAVLAAPDPAAGSGLTPWEIIEAARAHLAEQRRAEGTDAGTPAVEQATTAWPGTDPGSAPAAPASDPGRAPGAAPASGGAPAGAGPAPPAPDPYLAHPAVPPPGGPHPLSDPGGVPQTAPVTQDAGGRSAASPHGGGPSATARPGGPPYVPGARADGTPQADPQADPQAATRLWPGTDPGRTPAPEPPRSPAGGGTDAPAVPAHGAAATSVPPKAAEPGGPPWPAEATVVAPGDRPPAERVVEAYGTAFLAGPDDVERLLTEMRRRGRWVLSLRGQEVSSASAPAVLLVGDVSCGQRRLTRLISRALAEVGVTSGEVHTLTAEELAEIDPRELRGRLAEHGGHTLLIEGLDTVLLDDDRGAAYASALYRARVEGVSDTAVAATCAPDRLRELADATPELVADFRTVRLPDLSDPDLRVRLAALLAAERNLELTPEAWQVARGELTALRGRGRLTNARLVEAYLDHACTRHLGQAGENQVFQGTGGLTLTAEDVAGVAAQLAP